MYKIFIVLFSTISICSCTSSQSVVGKWEPIQKLNGIDEGATSMDIEKGSFFYITWEFRDDDSLVFSRPNSRPLYYNIKGDTIFITAANGLNVSAVRVLALTNKELRIQHILQDNSVEVFRRIR